MKLAELAQRTATSPATIKYWMRAGILPAGAKRNATTATYGQAHVDRIRLITYLRTELDADTPTIRGITGLLDNPATEPLDLLEACQVLAAGITATAVPQPQDDELISQLCAAIGWPDTASVARSQLATVLAECRQAGRPITMADLRLYAQSFQPLARTNVLQTAASGTPDQIAFHVIRGITLTTRLERSLSNLAHTAASMDLLNGPG